MKDKADAKEPSHRFYKAARELECDRPEERFDEALTKIGKTKSPVRQAKTR